MHLFSRVATLTGGPVEPVDWAVNITGKVNQIMDVEVSLWQGVFGYPLGTVAWSAMVESRAHLAEQTAKLAADSTFLELAGAGQAFATTPFEDALRSIVHMTREPEGSPPIGGWAEVTTATPAEGKIGEAMAWGVEIADAYTAATGTGCAFLADDYGTFGQVTWVAVHDDAAATDRASAAEAGDAAYLASVDGAGHLFQPGSANRVASIRVA
jgi:hypothetical protein